MGEWSWCGLFILVITFHHHIMEGTEDAIFFFFPLPFASSGARQWDGRVSLEVLQSGTQLF